ncbi:MAG: YidB family protein [Pyrinomonadaceae bacterium]
MALFDSIISGAADKFGLGDKAGTLLASLMGLMTNNETGGFSGFINRIKDAGLGDQVSSWIGSGDSTALTSDQVTSALGADEVKSIADSAGVDTNTASSALGFMIPQVVDKLSPDGELPDNDSIFSKISGFVGGLGGAAAGAFAGIAGTAGAVASGAVGAAGDAAGAVGDAAGAAVDKGKEVAGAAAGAVGDAAGAAVDKGKQAASAAAGAVGDTAHAVSDKASSAIKGVTDSIDGDGSGSILKWLIPLLLLILLLFIGFKFCGKNTTGGADTNANQEANASGETSELTQSTIKVESKDNKYFLTGTVNSEQTKADVTTEAGNVWGKDNVDASGLTVDTKAAAFSDGWLDNFKKTLALPGFKTWTGGSIAWVGTAINTAGTLPDGAVDKLKEYFTGWTVNSGDSAGDKADRQLTQIKLGDETLEAYPGGIEDQLITFINSDEYKNATDDQLKDKWFVFDDLVFKFGGTTLEPTSNRQLDNIAKILKFYPDVKMKIGGYTDKKGNPETNKKLSGDRAKTVQAELAKRGVGAQVPETEGYGDEFAKVPADASDQERAADRRTSARLLK